MRTTVRELAGSGPHVSVGAHAADLLHLGDQLVAVASGGAQVVHLDVMDGVFCPPITFGAGLVAAIPDQFVKDVHLMVDDPMDKIDSFVDAGASMITFHLESTRHPHRVLSLLGRHGVLRGVAINPGTPLGALEPLVDEVDLVLLLAIDPGWNGQSLSPGVGERVARTRAMTKSRELLVGVDGAITQENIEDVAALGVDLVVSGHAAFAGGDPETNTRALIQAARAGRQRGERQRAAAI